MQPIGSTGYIKVGENYINPHNITHIAQNQDGTTYVAYKTMAQGPTGFGPTSDRIAVDSAKFAQCAVKAMQTGEIIDIMA